MAFHLLSGLGAQSALLCGLAALQRWKVSWVMAHYVSLCAVLVAEQTQLPTGNRGVAAKLAMMASLDWWHLFEYHRADAARLLCWPLLLKGILKVDGAYCWKQKINQCDVLKRGLWPAVSASLPCPLNCSGWLVMKDVSAGQHFRSAHLIWWAHLVVLTCGPSSWLANKC